MATSIQDISFNKRRRKRVSSVIFIVLSILIGMIISERSVQTPAVDQPVAKSEVTISTADHTILQKYQTAQKALGDLAVKGLKLTIDVHSLETGGKNPVPAIHETECWHAI